MMIRDAVLSKSFTIWDLIDFFWKFFWNSMVQNPLTVNVFWHNSISFSNYFESNLKFLRLQISRLHQIYTWFIETLNNTSNFFHYPLGFMMYDIKSWSIYNFHIPTFQKKKVPLRPLGLVWSITSIQDSWKPTHEKNLNYSP